MPKKEQKFHQLFDPVLLETYKYGENIEWANKVRNAIEQDRIVTYYQPILNIQKNTIDKYEALVRLIDENGAVILPGSFLEIAKKSKQYLAITKKVLRDAIKMASENEVKISINMTIEDIESSDIVSVIETTLDTYGCGQKIVFEITETEEIKNYHALRGFIDFVKSRFGCEVSIDDFGSGYSNFENLLELDFDYLKIDGSIVKKVSDNVQSTILLDAIIAFSQKLHIATVAEYVYDEKVFELVKAKGVTYAQGFFIGKPIETLLPSHEWMR